jgi:uncharacterized protein CbrC (UPF0167 family)
VEDFASLVRDGLVQSMVVDACAFEVDVGKEDLGERVDHADAI